MGETSAEEAYSTYVHTQNIIVQYSELGYIGLYLKTVCYVFDNSFSVNNAFRNDLQKKLESN